MKKYFFIAAAVVGAMALLGSTLVPPIYVVRTVHIVDAPPEAVWDVLTNAADYEAWNPYLIKLEGKLAPGEKLKLVLVDGNFEAPLTVSATVAEVERPRQFYWTGTAGVPGVMDTRHHFVLEAEGRNQTRFTQYEEFRGLLAVLLPKQAERAEHTRVAFDSMGIALQKKFGKPSAAIPSA